MTDRLKLEVHNANLQKITELARKQKTTEYMQVIGLEFSPLTDVFRIAYSNRLDTFEIVEKGLQRMEQYDLIERLKSFNAGMESAAFHIITGFTQIPRVGEYATSDITRAIERLTVNREDLVKEIMAIAMRLPEGIYREHFGPNGCLIDSATLSSYSRSKLYLLLDKLRKAPVETTKVDKYVLIIDIHAQLEKLNAIAIQLFLLDSDLDTIGPKSLLSMTIEDLTLILKDLTLMAGQPKLCK